LFVFPNKEFNVAHTFVEVGIDFFEFSAKLDGSEGFTQGLEELVRPEFIERIMFGVIFRFFVIGKRVMLHFVELLKFFPVLPEFF